MASNEDDRYRLQQHLEEVLGRDDAYTLMEHLPPTGWANVATKDDVEHLRVSTTHHLDQLRAQMVHEFELRDARFERIDLRFQQVDARFDQVDARFDQMDQRFEQRFDTFRLEMKADMERAFRMQTFAIVGLMFTMLSAFLALQQTFNN
jgi:hypothetical protein